MIWVKTITPFVIYLHFTRQSSGGMAYCLLCSGVSLKVLSTIHTENRRGLVVSDINFLLWMLLFFSSVACCDKRFSMVIETNLNLGLVRLKKKKTGALQK